MPLKLDEYRGRWSWARGATKATETTSGRAITDLAAALAEVDGILAGINYLEKVEPILGETSPALPHSEHSAENLPSNTGEWGQLSHLTLGLPKLDATNGVSPEERSSLETRNLRNHLSRKLTASGDSVQRPRASQWATLRSLREASRYYYQQFTEATAKSTVPRIKKLWESYDSAKDMLEAGILTFQNVLHGQIPTTLVDIFALASLSYAISKILHDKGFLKEEEILSGILDWHEAIADEKERLTFEDIAKQLWPEARKIMHFIPVPREGMKPQLPILVRNDSANSTQAGVSMLREDLPSPEFHEDMPQANNMALPLMGDSVDDYGPLQRNAFRIFQETHSHEDFGFSDFCDWNAWDNMQLAELMDQPIWPPIPPDKISDFSDPFSLLQQSVGDLYSVHSGTPHSSTLNCDRSSPDEPFSGETSPPQSVDKEESDSQLDSLKDTPFFQTVAKYLRLISEQGDLLTVLSGAGILSNNDRTKSPHSTRPFLEFVAQAPKHIFEPLRASALRMSDTFVGIVAMTETFVNIGRLNNVREVENYIITVARSLAYSQVSFVSIVSATLIQCLTASTKMKWGLRYPDYVQEVDEYSIEYMHRREQAEKEWSDSVFLHPDTPEQSSKPSRQPKRTTDNSDELARKRPRMETLKKADKSRLSSASAPPATEHCLIENCAKSYLSRTSLSRHMRTKHGGILLKCPNCSREYDRRDNLRQHFLNIHSELELPDWIATKVRGLTMRDRQNSIHV